jgi:hypothetical protein
MSTNFYLRLPNTPEEEDGLHIGLRSGGWRFLFRAHEDLGLMCVSDWEKKFSEGKIVCEYGETYTPEEFMKLVNALQADAKSLHWWEAPDAQIHRNDTRFVDKQGYSFDRRNFS